MPENVHFSSERHDWETLRARLKSGEGRDLAPFPGAMVVLRSPRIGEATQ